MRVEKKIFLKTTHMILLTLACVFILNSFTFWLVRNNFENESSTDLLSVISEMNSFDISQDIAEFGDNISKYDYSLYVSDGNEILFSNLSNAQRDVFEKLTPPQVQSDISVTVDLDFLNRTVVTILKPTDNGSILMVAIDKRESPGILGPIQANENTNIIHFALICLAYMMIIVTISRHYAKQVVKKVMIPLNHLLDGVKRIESGDLTTSISYNGEDEFEMVCQSFNNMQASLLTEKNRINAYEKARTDMVASISHDLRTPLTSVKGYIKGVQDNIASTSEKREQYLSIAYKKACDMDLLLERLFNFSKLETGNMPFYKTETDLVAFTASFVEDIKADLSQQNIKLSLAHSDVHLYSFVDTSQMKQVFGNLVSNAIKYAKTAQLKLKIEVKELDNQIEIIFSDNGIGVPESQIENIFDQFYIGDSSRNDKNIDSNGLGLYIVKYILEMQGGSVKAVNNNGLNIVMRLPKITEGK